MGRRKLDNERHKRTYMDKRPYQCGSCSNSYTDKHQLVIHFRMHNGEECYRCNICRSFFAGRRALNRHLKTHRPVKPYKCMTCGKSFIEKGRLNRHLKKHTWDRPFICGICGKPYADKVALIKHIPIHARDRPCKSHKPTNQTCNLVLEEDKITLLKKYVEKLPHKSASCKRNPSMSRNKHNRFDVSCHRCRNGFVTMKHLSDHTYPLDAYTGEQPFPCEFCDKHFARKNTAMRHMGLHLGIEPYHCELCNKTFTQEKNLTIHMKSYDHLINVIDTNDEVHTEYIKLEEIDIKQEEDGEEGGPVQMQMFIPVEIKND